MSSIREIWDNYRIDPKYTKKYQWETIPSLLATMFVALTKGNDTLGFGFAFILGWLIYSFIWHSIYQLTVSEKEKPNTKQYDLLQIVTQVIFVLLSVIYVFGI